ncbi:MAG: hypothetical protein AAF564_13090 [Bacteroidota bacterium]
MDTTKTTLLLLVVVLMAQACNVLQENNADDVVITLDKPFRLYVGETARLGDEFQITFENLAEDSRCPLGTVCIWEGEIEAAFRVTTNSTSQSLPFQGFVGAGGDAVLQQLIGQYGIELQRVQPYPGTDAAIDEDKSAMLVVSRVDIR